MGNANYIVGRKRIMSEQIIDKINMKKFLIKCIDKLNGEDVNQKTNKEFLSKVQSSDLGASNIRSMANVALNCDCYEEFRIFMQYKKAKIDGWKIENDEGKALADMVISDMDEIFKMCDENDREALKWIGQYFGYFYWKKAAIEGEKEVGNRNNNYSNYGDRKQNYNRG